MNWLQIGGRGARSNSIVQGAAASASFLSLSTRTSQPAGVQIPTATHESGGGGGANRGALEVTGSSMLHGGGLVGSGSHAGSANVHFRGGTSMFSTSPPGAAGSLPDADELLGSKFPAESGGYGPAIGGGGGVSESHAVHEESGHYGQNYVRRAAPAGQLQAIPGSATSPMTLSIGIGARAPSSMGSAAAASVPMRIGSGQYVQHQPQQPVPPSAEYNRRVGGGSGVRERVRVSSGPSPSAGPGSLALAPIVSASGTKRATRVPPPRSRAAHSGGGNELRHSGVGSYSIR